MNNLQLGDTGRNVEVWQRFLVQVWSAEPDSMLAGVFDDATEQATRTFQEYYGLEVTGLVDRDTLTKARNLGLDSVEALVGKGIGKPTVLAGLVLLIMVSVLSVWILSPPTGLTLNGTPLPLDPSRAPGAARAPACPSWFC